MNNNAAKYGDVQHVAIERCVMDDVSYIRIPATLWVAAEEGELPPLHAKREGASFRIITGHEVWFAAQLAGFTSVPMVVDISSSARLNYEQNPIAEAVALDILKETHGLTDAELGERLRWTRKRVADFRRLLRLDPAVQELVRDGRLSYAAACELVSIPETRQRDIARHAVELRWSLADVRARARRWKTQRQAAHSAGRPASSATDATFAAESTDPNIRQIERTLSDTFGCPVRLDTERGMLVIAYQDLDILDGLLDRWHVLTG